MLTTRKFIVTIERYGLNTSKRFVKTHVDSMNRNQWQGYCVTYVYRVNSRFGECAMLKRRDCKRDKYPKPFAVVDMG